MRTKFMLSAVLLLFLLSGCGHFDNISNNQDSDGIPVYDRRTVLTVDPETNEVTELSNSFYHLDNLDKKPIIDCKKAKSLIEEKYDCKIELDPQLNIAFSYGDFPQLIWIVEVSQDDIANVIADAGNGEILYSEPSYIED